MKKLIILTVLLSSCAGHVPYATIGAGYKLTERDIVIEFNHPISARLELGIEQGNWSYGMSHHSQWFSGFPINNDDEYSKTEIFIDYTWRLKR